MNYTTEHLRSALDQDLRRFIRQNGSDVNMQDFRAHFEQKLGRIFNEVLAFVTTHYPNKHRKVEIALSNLRDDFLSLLEGEEKTLVESSSESDCD